MFYEISINLSSIAGKDVLNTFIAAQYSSQDNTPKCIEIVSVCDRNLKLENEKKVDTACEANFKKVCGCRMNFEDEDFIRSVPDLHKS